MTGNSPLVSVIIPVYNANKYLRDCIESVRKQTYNNIEVILIDDASTDGSKNLISEYMLKDKRIKAIFNKNNKGLASPNRNKGLSSANGDFVCFIDSDDHIDNNWVESLLKISLEKKSDITLGLVKVEVEDQGTTKRFGDINTYQDYYNIFLQKKVSESKLNMRASVCYSLYSKKIIDKYKLRFDERIRNGEDELWNLQFGYYVKKIEITDKKTYYHRRMRKGSIMTASDTTYEGVYSRLLMFKEAILFLNSKKDYPKQIYINHFLDFYTMMITKLPNLKERDVTNKITLLIDDILSSAKYKQEIFTQIGQQYLSKEGRIADLENMLSEKEAKLESLLHVGRSARLFFGNIKRKIMSFV